MIFCGAGCLYFCNTSYTILQFYHLQVQIKNFFHPPENEEPRGGRATRQGETPLRRAYKR